MLFFPILQVRLVLSLTSSGVAVPGLDWERKAIWHIVVDHTSIVSGAQSAVLE